MKKMKNKTNNVEAGFVFARGITLVALVITIIVLIILAGVSINAIMDDGLIDNSKEAKEQWNNGVKKEQSMMAELELVQAMPAGATIVEGDSSTGIVMKDSNNNEWVWVEVPKTIYKTATSSTDYEKIEADMITYVGSDKFFRESNYADGHYTELNATANEQCGLNVEEYTNNKNSMLKSVYENGGFWIGRYEAGIGDENGNVSSTARIKATFGTSNLPKAVVKPDAYPYNYVKCDQAQVAAQGLATGGKTSSLMYGIQWDLTMKFIEEKGKLQDGTDVTYEMLADLIPGSIAFGNYYNSSFNVNRGSYLPVDTETGELGEWTQVDGSFAKTDSVVALMLTGLTERNKVLNIYDLAGNAEEWTLEYVNYNSGTGAYCVRRGGGYWDFGTNEPVSYRTYGSYSNDEVSFRAVLW